MRDSNTSVQRTLRIHDQAATISATHQSPDGAVRVVLDSAGTLTDLQFGDAARRIPPSHLGGLVLACVRQAKAQIGAQFAQIVRDTGADEATTARLVSGYQARHPDQFAVEQATGNPIPPPPILPPAPPAAPPLTPATPRRPRRAGEEFDEDFSTMSVMQRGYRTNR
ncbi:MAG TPA: YbaB/EbfC family nucleoid-associated protein [Pseudonocardiaceae bacterium]